MFFFGDFVYGGEPKEPIKITDIKVLHDMIMLLTFSNGETRLFDATVLNGVAFEPLKDEKVFADAVLEHGVVTWQNGDIDCAPEYMYEHSYEYAPMLANPF